jgi:hypothetical protein
MPRSSYSQSLETQQLVKVLADKAHDPLFTYEEIEKASGVDPRKSQAALASARRIVLRDHGIVFVTVRKVGIKRATDSEIVDGSSSDLSRIRNTSRRALKKLGAVANFAELPADKQREFNVKSSTFAVLHHATTATAQRKLEAAVTKKTETLPVAETLAALGLERK